jgi:hypothetical protein
VFGGIGTEVVLRDVEFRDYVVDILNATLLGIGLGVAAAILAGGAVTLTAILIGAGIGAIAGFLLGVGLVKVQRITVYRYRGITKMKIEG